VLGWALGLWNLLWEQRRGPRKRVVSSGLRSAVQMAGWLDGETVVLRDVEMVAQWAATMVFLWVEY
jgi:hypothetical protein